jgi:uncharacterized protein (DUF58 family)
MKIHLQRPAVPITTCILFIVWIFDSSRVWTILLFVFGGVWLIAYLWTRLLAGNLHLQRERRVGWVQVNSQIEERLTLSNISFLPAPWMEVKDFSTLPNYEVRVAMNLEAGGFRQWHASATCEKRGLYRLGHAELETGDPFGIFKVTIGDAATSMLMVLPSIVPLPFMKIESGGFSGEGRPRPNTPEPSINAASVREHRAGDSRRLIHWPTTARQGKFFVRLFENAPAGDWWILLDLDEHAQTGDGVNSTEEAAVTLAASLADLGLARKKRVGLLINGREPARLPPRHSEAQRWEILYALAQAAPSDLDLNLFLGRSRPAVEQHASLIIVTASARPDWFKHLELLKQCGIRPTILFLDPASFGGDQSSRPLVEILQKKGYACHLITREQLKKPETRAKQSGKWAWQYIPTGQFVAVHVQEGAASKGMP